MFTEKRTVPPSKGSNDEGPVEAPDEASPPEPDPPTPETPCCPEEPPSPLAEE
jgi:hypothetical protein